MFISVTPFDWSGLSGIFLAWLLYFLAIIILKRSIKPGKSLKLSWIAAFHNLLLSVASLWMFLGVAACLKQTVAQSSWKAVYCPKETTITATNPFHGKLTHHRTGPSMLYWLYAFYLSKYYELLDTLLLVCRGKPLTLLHVWHHLSVLVETWAWIYFDLTFASLGMLFNTFIHVWMYSYFAAAVLHIRVPWRKWITSMQIVQFFCSFLLTLPYLYFYWLENCGGHGMPALIISSICNASYLILFLQFYRRAYHPSIQSK